MAPWEPFFFPSAVGSRVPRRRSNAPTVYAVRFILSLPWVLRFFAVDEWRCVRPRLEPLGLDAGGRRRRAPLPRYSGSRVHTAAFPQSPGAEIRALTGRICDGVSRF